MIKDLSDKELANMGLEVYSSVSERKLRKVLSNVDEEVKDELNFKKSLDTFEKYIKSLCTGRNSGVLSVSNVVDFCKPVLKKGFEFYLENPQKLTEVIDSIEDNNGVNLRSFGVNEKLVGDFMKHSSGSGSVKDGFSFIMDSLLGQLGYVPRLVIEDKLKQFSNYVNQMNIGEGNNGVCELSQAEQFGLELVKLSDDYRVSVEDLLTDKNLAPHLSNVYSFVFGLAGVDYAREQVKMTSLVYNGLVVLDDLKGEFIHRDLSDRLKSFKVSEGGLVANLVNSRIDSLAKRTLVPTIEDFSVIGRSFGKHTLAQNITYVKHFE